MWQESNTSSGKGARPRLFLIQQLVDAVADSESDDDVFLQEYNVILVTVSLTRGEEPSDNEHGARTRSRESPGERGHVPQTADGGDAIVFDGGMDWPIKAEYWR